MTFDEAIMIDEGAIVRDPIPMSTRVTDVILNQHQKLERLCWDVHLASVKARWGVVNEKYTPDEARERTGKMHRELYDMRSAIDALLTMTGGVQ